MLLAGTTANRGLVEEIGAGGEKFRLFPSGEAITLVYPVEVIELVMTLLGLASWRTVDLAGKHGRRTCDGTMLRAREASLTAKDSAQINGAAAGVQNESRPIDLCHELSQ